MSGGRIRSVKPEWLEDELLAFASLEARVASVGLILLADDYGNGRGNIAWLRGQLFPGDDSIERTRAAIEELERMRYVVLYEVDGQRYFSIRNWEKHQKVDKPGKPRVPGPPAKQPKKPREKTAKETESLEQVREESEKSRETLAKVPESLAPDLDLDLEEDQDREGDQRARTRENPIPPRTVVQLSLERQHLEAVAKSFEPTRDASAFPPNFEPSPDNRALAARLGLDLEEEISGLRNNALGKGRISCAWHAELDTWLRRSAKFDRDRPKARERPGFARRETVQPNHGVNPFALVPQE